ncbi:MAG: hypothetical protein AB7S80_17370 [Rhizobiaceae bacterium]
MLAALQAGDGDICGGAWHQSGIGVPPKAFRPQPDGRPSGKLPTEAGQAALAFDQPLVLGFLMQAEDSGDQHGYRHGDREHENQHVSFLLRALTTKVPNWFHSSSPRLAALNSA